jgi:hypothetical protein
MPLKEVLCISWAVRVGFLSLPTAYGSSRLPGPRGPLTPPTSNIHKLSFIPVKNIYYTNLCSIFFTVLEVPSLKMKLFALVLASVALFALYNGNSFSR